jgi:hypothetical protein
VGVFGRKDVNQMRIGTGENIKMEININMEMEMERTQRR